MDPIFEGVGTALITPFRDDVIDYPAFGKLIDRQLAGNVGALVVAGTTGESPTLTYEELGSLVSFAKQRIGSRVPLIAGCGANCTSRACELARVAVSAGADALLAVTPYYNKTSDSGLILHYRAICSAAGRPVLVYNVPSRTGLRLTMDHYRALAEMDGIVGVKEASGDLSLLDALVCEFGDRLAIYTGNDDQIVSSMRLGARGVISVYSNLYPAETSDLCSLCLAGDFPAASVLHRALLPGIRALFCEVNPIPVKYVASRLGLCLPEYRLPLCPPSPTAQATLDAIFGK